MGGELTTTGGVGMGAGTTSESDGVTGEERPGEGASDRGRLDGRSFHSFFGCGLKPVSFWFREGVGTGAADFGRGRLTSASSGGGCGARSSDGRACKANSPARSSAAPFPAAFHLTRNPMHAKGWGPCSSPPPKAGVGARRQVSYPVPYATLSRSSAMSASWSSTQSPGLREKTSSLRCWARTCRSSGSIVSAR